MNLAKEHPCSYQTLGKAAFPHAFWAEHLPYIVLFTLWASFLVLLLLTGKHLGGTMTEKLCKWLNWICHKKWRALRHVLPKHMNLFWHGDCVKEPQAIKAGWSLWHTRDIVATPSWNHWPVNTQVYQNLRDSQAVLLKGFLRMTSRNIFSMAYFLSVHPFPCLMTLALQLNRSQFPIALHPFKWIIPFYFNGCYTRLLCSCFLFS